MDKSTVIAEGLKGKMFDGIVFFGGKEHNFPTENPETWLEEVGVKCGTFGFYKIPAVMYAKKATKKNYEGLYRVIIHYPESSIEDKEKRLESPGKYFSKSALPLLQEYCKLEKINFEELE